ncbi:MAG: hypothetical protein JNJ48_03985 [Phycisphaerae bacterium]|nr:hypothetical protein [Phycisphaerae bacterium]
MTRSTARRLIAGALTAALAFAAGCDESDAGSVKIKLKPDGGGSITAACLTVPAAGPAEAAMPGVTWQARGGVIASTGEFAALNGLALADAAFSTFKEGDATVTVLRLPRGAAARWPAVLSVPAAAREQAGKILDPDAADQKRASKIGTTGKFEIHWPGRKIVSHGVDAKKRGLSSDAERDTATLIVPLDWMRTDGEPVEWRITWE